MSAKVKLLPGAYLLLESVCRYLGRQHAVNPSVVALADQRQPRPLAVVVHRELLLRLEHPWGAVQ